MKLGFRLLASALALFYFLTPAAFVFAQTGAPPPSCQLLFQTGIDYTGAPILSDSVTIPTGGAVTLVWQSQNATGGNITGVGSVGPSGSMNILPPSPIVSNPYITVPEDVFTGTFTGPGGTATCQTVVIVSSGSSGTSAQTTTATSPTTPAPTTATTPSSPNGGLVPCGTGEKINSNQPGTTPNQNDATGCQACNLAQLVSLIINFVIGLSIPIAAALFAYAGVLYFTSGANPANKEKAKAVFKHVLIGFIIAITGWLVVNTLLHALLDGGKLFSGGNWFTIQCTTQPRVVDATLNQVLSSLPMLGGSSNSLTTAGTSAGGGAIDPDTGAYVNNESAGPAGTCGSGYTYMQEGGDVSTANCFNPDTGTVQNVMPYATSGAGNSGAGTAQWQPQLQQACTQTGLSDCTLAQSIMANECGSGNPNCLSPAGAIGLMQVEPTTACSMNLSSAPLSGCSTCVSMADNTNGNCSQVAQQLYNPTTNMTYGTAYLQQLSSSPSVNGNPTLVAAAYNGGLGAVQSSTVCPGQLAYQCTTNTGYAETRNYVTNVTGTYSKLGSQ